MSDTLDHVTRCPASVVATLTPRITDAAYRATVEHVAVDVDGLRLVPDTLLLEVRANGHVPPRTASLTYADTDPEDVAGRVVWVYRYDPRPKHPDEVDRVPRY